MEPLEPEFIICVRGLPPELRYKFLKGFTKTFHEHSLSFEPPFKWEIRALTPAERQQLARSAEQDESEEPA